MPLQLANEHRFPIGVTAALDDAAVNDFLSLMKKVSAPIDKQKVIEIYKQYLCKASGDTYMKSTSFEWAENDMAVLVRNVAVDAPNFIAAVYDSFEELKQKYGANVPQEQNFSKIFHDHQQHFQIVDGQLVTSSSVVAAPKITESESKTVMRALQDAQALIGTVNSTSAIDRAHTALHGYLIQLCSIEGIPIPVNATVSNAFKELRKSHPALLATGNRATEITRILNSFATSIDAFSTLRNHASLAHVNELLDVPEATATINAMHTIFRYVQDCLTRQNQLY
ncbi:abortive infection family protein [Vibrio diazotrophicus]|uniref:abortive infection family protein n=1 Tax=Vibrio diazotrophicus TaxID=685 RepID=UPI000C9DBB2B|nr:abortive infection family protein [Vibrio diazotrophicus]PNH94240.1 hypothetical protein C1O24_18215 [Vibrio diazotrophicus]